MDQERVVPAKNFPVVFLAREKDSGVRFKGEGRHGLQISVISVAESQQLLQQGLWEGESLPIGENHPLGQRPALQSAVGVPQQEKTGRKAGRRSGQNEPESGPAVGEHSPDASLGVLRAKGQGNSGGEAGPAPQVQKGGRAYRAVSSRPSGRITAWSQAASTSRQNRR